MTESNIALGCSSMSKLLAMIIWSFHSYYISYRNPSHRIYPRFNGRLSVKSFPSTSNPIKCNHQKAHFYFFETYTLLEIDTFYTRCHKQRYISFLSNIHFTQTLSSTKLTTNLHYRGTVLTKLPNIKCQVQPKLCYIYCHLL